MVYIPHQSGERIVDINFDDCITKLCFSVVLLCEGQQFYEQDSVCDVGLWEKCTWKRWHIYGKYQK